MKVALVFPPLAVPTQPYSSLPALSAFIRDRKRHRVSQFDANIEFTRAILTRRALLSAARRIHQTLKAAKSAKNQVSLNMSEEGYWQLVTAAMKAPLVVNLIDQAVNDLRTPEVFRDLARLNRAKRVVCDAFDVISASWFPVCLSGSDSNPTRFSCLELVHWAKDREGNPFRSFLEKRLIPRLLRTQPALVGVSIGYESQLMAAVTLCRLFKEQLPGLPIVLGGNIVTCWYDYLEKMPEIFEWCDYLIPFEGESALDELLTSLESRRPLDRVPNLVYRRDSRIVRNPRHCEDINDLPTPDYRGLPLHSYLSPYPVFLLNASRGCYWSSCHFCSVSPALRGSYRERRPDRVMRDIETLRAKHGAQCFMFGDDCVSPRHLRGLACGLAEVGREVSWQCEVRFEPELTTELIRDLSRSGCRNLIFGLESHSARVLSLMNKGIRLHNVDRILNDCRQHEIAFNLQLFFGFPGETEADARETVEFILTQMHGAATCSFGLFRLLRGSAVARSPEEFEIRIKADPGALLYAQLDYEPVTSHAPEVKRTLRREILARTNWPHLGFALDAHTLLFLHEAGVSRMAREYYREQSGGPHLKTVERSLPSDSQRLVRKGNQTIMVLDGFPRAVSQDEDPATKRILVYDFDLNRTVELSRLAAWVLQQFKKPKSTVQLRQVVRRQAGDGVEVTGLLRTLDSIIVDLRARDLLVRADA